MVVVIKKTCDQGNWELHGLASEVILWPTRWQAMPSITGQHPRKHFIIAR
jgi:hypothetical protein